MFLKDLTVYGTITEVNRETVTVSAPLIKLADSNTSDMLPLSVYGRYVDIENGTIKYGGLMRTPGSAGTILGGSWVIFNNNTLDLANSEFVASEIYRKPEIFADLHVGSINARGQGIIGELKNSTQSLITSLPGLTIAVLMIICQLLEVL